MRIVVTGGAGFVGKHLIDWLGAREHELLVIDDFSTGRRTHLRPDVELHVADLTTMDAGRLGGIISNFRAQAVIHLAAMHFIPDCIARPERTFRVNTEVTHTLVEALVRNPVERFVLASTMDVYDVADRNHAETDMVAPANVYGLSKALSENIVYSGFRRGAFKSAVALRLANVYGPNETNPHLIPDVVSRLLNRSDTEIKMGYLGASRDFVFVKEVASAFGAAATLASDGIHCLNVGTGLATSVRQVVQMLQGLVGDERPLRESAAIVRQFDRASLTPQVSAVRNALGWRATLPLMDGLAEVVRSMSHTSIPTAVNA